MTQGVNGFAAQPAVPAGQVSGEVTAAEAAIQSAQQVQAEPEATPESPPAGETTPEAAVPAERKPGELARETVARARRSAALQRQRTEAAGLQRERAEAAQARQELARTREELARHRAELESSDPLELVRRRGLTAKQLVERALADGTPEAKIAALEAQLAETNESIRTFQQRQATERAQAEQAARVAGAREQFHQNITAEEFPRLEALPRSYREAICQATFAEAQRKGYTPSDEEVLEYVEAKLAGKKPTPAPGKQAPTSAPSAGKKAPPSRTVTSKLQTAQFVPPSNWDQMDDREQRKLLAAHYARVASKGG